MPPQVAINALLARHGLRAARTKLISQLDCEIHRITPVRPHGVAGLAPGTDLALRIYAAARLDTAPIQAEMRWLRALVAQGLHVPLPLADLDGHTLHCWQPDPTQPARWAMLLTWLPGRTLDRGLRPVHLLRAGELAARMHNTAQALRQSNQLPSQRIAEGPDLNAWAEGRMARTGHLRACDHAGLQAAAQRLRLELQALGRGTDEHGWIHGDLHLWNLLFHGPEAGAIDFSDGGLGHHAHDLAKTLQYLHTPLSGFRDHGAMVPRMREQLLAGYARHRALPPAVEHQIDVYLAVHALNTVEWILTAWPRPDARPWGPAFLAGAAALLRPWQA